MRSDVWILGGYQSDFARNLSREGREFSDLTREVLASTLTSAGVGPELIEVVHVGNAFGELFAGQGHLGAMPATVCEDLVGVPSSRHEAACASGSVALRAAMADLVAGDYDVALVMGIELERTVAAPLAAQHLGAASWVGHEGVPGTVIWADMFDQIAEEYDRRYGVEEIHLRAIGELNLANAKANHQAQTREWNIPPITDDDDTNPVVHGRLRRYDCSQITDGGAGLVLVSDRFLAQHPTYRPLARIAGWGHRGADLPLADKLRRSANEPFVFPHVRRAIVDALTRAEVDLAGVDGLETHDCFTPSEYVAIDHFGLTAPGESWQAVEDGRITREGSFPINPSGGLIGGGHPVGATGVRMVLDATRQVSGTAGEYQVEGARRFATLNIGGSMGTAMCFVVEAVEKEC